MLKKIKTLFYDSHKKALKDGLIEGHGVSIMGGSILGQNHI